MEPPWSAPKVMSMSSWKSAAAEPPDEPPAGTGDVVRVQNRPVQARVAGTRIGEAVHVDDRDDLAARC